MTKRARNWRHCARFGTLLDRMWSLRVAALRAAGLAALALGFKALKWLVHKHGAQVNHSPTLSPTPQSKEEDLGLSPFKRASMEYGTLSKDQSGERGSELVGSPEPTVSLKPSLEAPAQEADKPQIIGLEQECGSNSEGSSVRGVELSGSESGSDSNEPCSRNWGSTTDGVAHVHTPDSQSYRQTQILGSPKYSFPHVDYEPEKSPYDLSYQEAHGSFLDAPASPNGIPRSGRHSRQPSFPVVDYEPEHRGGFSSSSQADSFDMAPAPTEEGDAIAKVEEALADIEGDLGVRRHSRSFSEPNLAARLLQQQQQLLLQQQKHLQAPGSIELESSEDDETLSRLAQGNEAASSSRMEHSNERPPSNGNTRASGQRSTMPSKRSRDEQEIPPLLRLDILSGPASGRELTIDDPNMQVTIGRTPDNVLSIADIEVSGHHAELQWDSTSRCWEVRDLGSLNGSRLNGNFISTSLRKPGKSHRLNADDILLLGSRTAIKIIYLPNAGKPDVPQNLKRVYAPPSSLQPTITLKSEAMANLRAEVGIEKAIQAGSLRLEGAVLCRLGSDHQRKGTPCEDVPFWGDPGRYQAALYCVFDGHCGRSTASKCSRLLPEELRKQMGRVRPRLDTAEGAGEIWEEVFLATDASLDDDDGATATAVLVWKDKAGHVCLQSANVGDSAAVFCKSGGNPRSDFQKLTADHRISDPDEKKRLLDLGIDLGKNRTRLYGLNLSRCLGDKFIKGADLGIIAVPFVSKVARLAPHESGILVMASDGLWDVAEPGRIMEVAVEAQKLPASNPETIADAIYQYAMKQRTRDDVCIFVLCFYPEENFLS